MQRSSLLTRNLRAAGALFAATSLVSLGACSSGSDDSASSEAGSGQVVVSSFGGSFQDAQEAAYYKPFQAETGTVVVRTEGSSYDKVKAMVNSGQVDWNVVDVEGTAYINLAQEELLEPLDYTIIDAQGIPAEFQQQYGLGWMVFGQNLAWSTKAFPDGMTPAQFFDPSVEARRALPAEPTYTLEFALLGDGVSPDELYPLDVDRAFAALDRIKDQVVAFKASADIQQLIQQNELDAAFVPNGRMQDAIDSGAQWLYTWEGAVADYDWWVVPKGAQDVDKAMEFINFAAQPKNQAVMSQEILYGPTNVDAFEFLDAERAAKLPGAPENSDVTASLDIQWWAENRTDVKSRWDAWLLNR